MYAMIEFFSGSKRISNFFKSMGWKVLTVDYEPKYKADLCINIYDHLDIDFYKNALGVSNIDFIWASPDCATYSLAAGSLHRFKGSIPKSYYAKYCDYNNTKFITWLRSLKIPFIVENPLGHFQKMDFIKGLFRYDVDYLSYGGKFLKPTCFFSNMVSLCFKPAKFRVNKIGISLQSVTSGDYLSRCYIPDLLIVAIYDNVKNFILSKNLLFSYVQLSIFDLFEEVV